MNSIRKSREAWVPSIRRKEWETFLAMTFEDPSRLRVYKYIKEYLKGKPKKKLLEIGFGQCHDFDNFFKGEHDLGSIDYAGIDITKQFVDYAISKYPNYSFSEHNFFESPIPTDILYIRGVIEHQAPEISYTFIETMLKNTRELSILGWFCPPGEVETFSWIPTDGFESKGAFVNTLSHKKVMSIIEDSGFSYYGESISGGCVGVVYFLLRK